MAEADSVTLKPGQHMTQQQPLLVNLQQGTANIVYLVKNINVPGNFQKLQDYARAQGPFQLLVKKIFDQYYKKQAGSINHLIRFADYLDDNEFYALADKIDLVIEIASMSKNDSLISIADWLDSEGLHALADRFDETSKIIKMAEDYGFFPKKMSKEEEENQPTIKAMHESSLSTRYCPDHNGVQTICIGEHIYQCPLDGKKYDYQTGYVNYEGQRVPGGSVAAQTPTTSDYGGIPMRIYDSRSDILNRLN